MLMTYFTPEHDIFRKSFRDFVTKELVPHVDQWERDESFPREVFKRMGDLGYFGIHFPEEVGGGGGDYWYTVVYGEEMIRTHSAGLNMSFMVQTEIATPIIAELGTKEQQQEFLVPAIKGEKIAALGITEPNAGSDVANIKTTAKKDGGDYVINGSKTFITNGTRADFITLAVRTGGPGFGGVSLVILPTDVKGFTVARKLKKMGNHASDTAELAFEDCRVPRRYLIGDENQGFKYIMMNFQGERLIAAIAANAAAKQALDEAVKYGRDRQAFGRPIGSFQVWRHQFAELYAHVEASKWLTYRACDLFNQKQPAVNEITMSKLVAGELAIKVIDRCLQFHGGYGYMDEYPISRAYRDIRLLTIGAGTSEIMKEILSKWMGLG
jgi:citronellyl-CoA dehydrogenase